ncbi:MAG: beta-ketoacyl-[acyl-carrier-protein] synthase family protein [Clostridiales bacterium]|nr:beta-ketoacyl-[acyl-carrier-protein] synthase family protein [Clostridiales bacterium]
MNKKLVITGMGAITPIGIGVDSYWNNLIEGKTGIDLISSIDTDDMAVKIGGEVKDFDSSEYMPKRKAAELDRFMQMAFAAAAQAIEDSRIHIEPYRTGITVGTAMGGFSTTTETARAYDRARFKKVGPRFLAKSLGNVCASHIAIANEIHGPSMTVNTACASGGDAMSMAAMMLEAGTADTMVVVGSEAAIDTIMIQSLISAMALSTENREPEKACRPFDRDRTGFVVGEGAGALIIETREHAIKRGAKIYAEFMGFGNNTDAYHPVTPRPDGEGELLCMKQALEMAELDADKIDYINTHGTATIKGDIVEAQTVKSIFDAHVKAASTKAATGHMMGAGGITEVIACVKSIETGLLPPTLNLDNKDEECPLKGLSDKTQNCSVTYAMSNAFGFGGQNSSIIVGKYED